MPTEVGLRLFVHGLLEVGGLSAAERESIEGQCAASGRSMAEVLEQASNALSGLSRCAGLVVAPRSERALRHIEFVHLGPGRALVVIVTDGYENVTDGDLARVVASLPAEHSALVGVLLRGQLRFWYEIASLEMRLTFSEVGVSVDARALVEAIGAMHAEIKRLSAPQAA